MNYFLTAALVPLVAVLPYIQSLNCINVIFNLRELVSPLAGRAVQWHSCIFWTLFVFRYFRLFVHVISFWCFYKPIPAIYDTEELHRNISVIVPTIDFDGPHFKECLESCLMNTPRQIVLVTAGETLFGRLQQIVNPYKQRHPFTEIQVHRISIVNKRAQIAHGLRFVTGTITFLLDDHVFWPSPRFLPTVLAPFRDGKVGAVATNKRVRRTHRGLNFKSFWNMIGALYLERHNFEIRATNAIDGGVFVVSGRTAAYRTSILRSYGLMDDFVNERFFFGKFGPLLAGDDNFLTRRVVAMGYNIKVQYCEDAMIETNLGAYPKFLSQCLRWARTTWVSNATSLFTDRTVWYRQLWCVYAVYMTSFVNFALFYDAALVYSLSLIADRPAIYALSAWILISKVVKLVPYFVREPQDLLMLPGYFVFAYYHSLLKLYALLTFWVCTWCGRDLDAIDRLNDAAQQHVDVDNGSSFNAGPGLRSGSSSSSSSSSSDNTTRPHHVAVHRRPVVRQPASSSPFDRGDALTTRRQSSQSPSPPRASSSASSVDTPWGAVIRANLHARSADVLESHLSTSRSSSRSSPRSSPRARLQAQQSGSILPTQIVNPTDPILFGSYRERGSSSTSTPASSTTSSIPFVGSDGRRVSTMPSISSSRTNSLAENSLPSPPRALDPIPQSSASISTINLSSPVIPSTRPTSISRVESLPSSPPSASTISTFPTIPSPFFRTPPYPTPLPTPSVPELPASPYTDAGEADPHTPSSHLPSPSPSPNQNPSPRPSITPIPSPIPSPGLQLAPSPSVHTPLPSPTPPSSPPSPVYNKPVYQRSWLRGPRCQHLHHEGEKLCPASGACLMENVFVVGSRYGGAVVEGRPRF